MPAPKFIMDLFTGTGYHPQSSETEMGTPIIIYESDTDNSARVIPGLERLGFHHNPVLGWVGRKSKDGNHWWEVSFSLVYKSGVPTHQVWAIRR